VLLLAVPLAGCVHAPSGDASEPRPDGTRRERTRRVPKGPPLEVAPELRPRLDTWWVHYLADDPQWPAARAEWLALDDEAATNVLIESLIREMIRGTNEARIGVSHRAMDELAAVGPAAVPHLIVAVEAGDDILREQAQQVLERIGPPAAQAVLASLDRAPTGAPYRRELVEALGAVGGSRARERLIDLLSTDGDWRIRASAALALGRLGGSAAQEALLAALRREEDPFVRERVAMVLGSFATEQVVEGLIAGLRREAGGDGHLRVARACIRSLMRLTGERHGSDVEAWMRWWRSSRAEWSERQGS